MISSKPTIFCDIDGTLVKHVLPTESCKKNHKLEILEEQIPKYYTMDLVCLHLT